MLLPKVSNIIFCIFDRFAQSNSHALSILNQLLIFLVGGAEQHILLGPVLLYAILYLLLSFDDSVPDIMLLRHI